MSNSSCVLVCLSGKKDCLDLIKAGNALALRDDVKLSFLLILPQNACFTPDSDTLNLLYEYAKEYNAEFNVLFNDCPAVSAAKFARKVHAYNIVAGVPEAHSSRFVSQIHSFLPDIPINLVEKNKVYHVSDALMSEDEKPVNKTSHIFL